eukprot:7641116-Pyramimonas_sp.AAC.2
MQSPCFAHNCRRALVSDDVTLRIDSIDFPSISDICCALVLQAAPLVGSVAPDWTAEAVFDQEFMTCKMSDYRGKYVVLFFYPLDFTFVCPTGTAHIPDWVLFDMV